MSERTARSQQAVTSNQATLRSVGGVATSGGEAVTGADPANGGGNAAVTRVVNAPADVVWSVLSDGWLYATWVVGASRIREVDPGWPGVGKCVHHSFGIWPLVIDDTSEVLVSVPERELKLRARGWPAGEAEVHLTLTPDRAEHTTVSIVEDAVAGPGTLIPRAVRQLAIAPRNVEALRRLALIAEGRYRERLAT
jgi:hypothetical protein